MNCISRSGITPLLFFIGENMKQEKKVEYLKRQIEKLKSEVCDLKSENKALSQENNALKRINSSNAEIIDSMSEQMKETQQNYLSCLDELKSIRGKYHAVVSSVRSLRLNYKNEMELLLSKLRKQK